MEVHQRLVGVITNPDGETFRDEGHATSFHDFSGTPDDPTDDTVTVAGLVFGIPVPGTGIIAQDTGLVSFNPDGSVVFHGPHEVLMQRLAPLICQCWGEATPEEGVEGEGSTSTRWGRALPGGPGVGVVSRMSE
jgi:hypothetical protein